MFGLEFNVAELVNVGVGAVVAAVVALLVAYRSTRQMQRQVAIVADFIEGVRDGTEPIFLRDKDGFLVVTGREGESAAEASAEVSAPGDKAVQAGTRIEVPDEEDLLDAGYDPPDPWEENG